jgi:hypothetical protein
VALSTIAVKSWIEHRAQVRLERSVTRSPAR